MNIKCLAIFDHGHSTNIEKAKGNNSSKQRCPDEVNKSRKVWYRDSIHDSLRGWVLNKVCKTEVPWNAWIVLTHLRVQGATEAWHWLTLQAMNMSLKVTSRKFKFNSTTSRRFQRPFSLFYERTPVQFSMWVLLLFRALPTLLRAPWSTGSCD